MSRFEQMHNDYLDPDKYFGEEAGDNSETEEAFRDHEGPFDVYYSTYKAIECGPTIGFLIEYAEEDAELLPKQQTKWFYSDDLAILGNWEQMREQGNLIIGISVSSIVEGSDAEVAERIINIDPLGTEAAEITSEFDLAVQQVNEEARELWDEAHPGGEI